MSDWPYFFFPCDGVEKNVPYFKVEFLFVSWFALFCLHGFFFRGTQVGYDD